MSGVQEYVVSASGQMSLPAAVRHRWNLDDGGPVDVIDLGFGVLTVPKGAGRRLLDDLLSRDDHLLRDVLAVAALHGDYRTIRR